MAAAVIAVLAIFAFAWSTRNDQPHWHAATARVIAIAPSQHRFHPQDSYVVVRNPHGTGQLTLSYPLQCDVGDTVPVEQAGVVLRQTPRTCR